MLKKLMAGILSVSLIFSSLPVYVMAVPSGAAIEQDEDDDYTPARRSDDTDENEDGERRIGEGQFVYSEESSTEPTTVAIIVDQSGVSTPEGITANLNIQAEGAALIDAKTGTLLYGKHAENKMYPASMTKVMTLLVACENGNLDDLVTVSENAVNSIPWDSSKMGLEAGEQLSLSDLLYGLILVSGNDAAMVIAEHIGGSEEGFVEMMNAKAKELGCENTHFVNPHGYHDDAHYTTPLDMARIAQAASQNEKVNEIWGSADHSVPATSKHEARVLNHSDKMIQPTTRFYDERVKGGKTGFHNQAMNTLASYGINGEIELVAVVMKDNGYDPTYEDTKTLFDYGFALYDERKLYGREQFERVLPVIQYYRSEPLDLGTVNVTLEKDLTAYTPSFINAQTVGIKYDLPEKLIAPVHKDDVLGKVTISYADMELGSVNIIALDTVEETPEAELDRQRMRETFVKILKTVFTLFVVAVVLFAAVILGLRAWFRSQRKRKRSGKSSPHNDKKKKKVKIKLK